MSRCNFRWPLVAVTLLLLPVRSEAADLPLPGTKLRLERSGGAEKLVLVLNDSSVFAPAPGSSDDPAETAGLRVVLFGHDFPGEIAEVVAPPGRGHPGWKRSAPGRYRYRNGSAPQGPSPVRSISLREGRGLRVVARAVGLGLGAPQGAVGVRVEMGSTRLCARFEGAAVLRDEPGLFIAGSAAAPGLVECTDDGLFGVACEASGLCGGVCADGSQCGGIPGLGCSCLSPSQPCGDTEPVCNGTCPAGEACTNVGGVPYPDCACLPEGSVGCGTVYPTCGDGACPDSLGCFVTTFTCCGGVSITGCACLSGPPVPPCGGPCPPGSTCAAAPGFPEACYPTLWCGSGTCPSGSVCGLIPGTTIDACLPIPCDAGTGFPTCDGTCTSGLTCKPFVQGAGACYCAP